MTKLILLLAMSFGSLLTMSQQNYVEVSVSETVELKATQFIYTISTKKNPFDALRDYDFDVDDNDDIDRPESLGIDEIAKILDKENFTYTHSKALDYSLSHADGELIVVLKSIEELNRLRKRLLMEEEGIFGKITETSYESLDKHYGALYSSLMEKAKKQAAVLAKTAGKKVGQVLQITDAVEGSGGDFLGNYMKSIMEMVGDREGNQLIEYKPQIVTKTYRFEMI